MEAIIHAGMIALLGSDSFGRIRVVAHYSSALLAGSSAKPDLALCNFHLMGSKVTAWLFLKLTCSIFSNGVVRL